MNHTELKLARQFLFFTQSEAAELIGNCTRRQWQNYESGIHPIPENVIDLIKSLYLFRQNSENLINSLEKEHKNNPLYYKPIQSAKAEKALRS